MPANPICTFVLHLQNKYTAYRQEAGKSLAQNLSGGEKKTINAEFSDKLLHHKKQGGSLPQAPPAVWPTADGEC